MYNYSYYTKWFEQLALGTQNFEQLFNLFRQLLLQTNGDVNEALNWMTTLNNRYQFTDGLGEFIDKLKEEGLISEQNDVLFLTGKGNQTIRKTAFNEIFSNLRKRGLGQHAVPKAGKGIERLPETKSYSFGDPLENIETTRSLSNAIRREGLDNFHLTEDDLEVYETEHLASCATVLLIDISHSMVLYGEDRITPAKNVALALSEFIMQN